jgi:7-carboxy-7-deazaguanine synthase
MQAESNIRKGSPLIRISEIYTSLQGEGLLTGTPSVFLRTSGCNLRCWFCDTRFASWEPEGDHRSLDDIVASVAAFNVPHVVLTGGEPMIYNSLTELTQRLKAKSASHITIETAGTIYQPVVCDLMSISPKLSSSAPPASVGSWHLRHHARRENLKVVRRLMEYPYQLKFVVDSVADAEEVVHYLERLAGVSPERVLLMPQGTDLPSLERTASWLRSWCDENGFTFCPRAHIEWYGNRRGT